MKKIVCLAFFFFLPLIYCNPCSPEQPRVSKEEKITTEIIKEGQLSIQQEPEGKKSSPLTKGVSPQAEYKETTISIKDNPVRGNRNARLVLIDFLDYQ